MQAHSCEHTGMNAAPRTRNIGHNRVDMGMHARPSCMHEKPLHGIAAITRCSLAPQGPLRSSGQRSYRNRCTPMRPTPGPALPAGSPAGRRAAWHPRPSAPVELEGELLGALPADCPQAQRRRSWTFGSP